MGVWVYEHAVNMGMGEGPPQTHGAMRSGRLWKPPPSPLPVPVPRPPSAVRRPPSEALPTDSGTRGLTICAGKNMLAVALPSRWSPRFFFRFPFPPPPPTPTPTGTGGGLLGAQSPAPAASLPPFFRLDVASRSYRWVDRHKRINRWYGTQTDQCSCRSTWRCHSSPIAFTTDNRFVSLL
jgi:hypothetical protein